MRRQPVRAHPEAGQAGAVPIGSQQHVDSSVSGSGTSQPVTVPARTGTRAFRLPGARVGRALLLADVAAFAVAVLLAGERLSPLVVAVLLLSIVVLYTQGDLYRARLTLSLLDDLPALLGRALLAGSVVTALDALVTGSARPRVLHVAGVYAALAVIARSLGYAVLREARRRGFFVHRTLILGGGQVAAELARTLLAHPVHGLRPVGFLDAHPLLPAEQWPVRRLGSDDELSQVIAAHDIGNVVVAFGSTPESRVVDLLRACDRMACEIFFVPRLYELSAVGRGIEMVWGMPLVRLRRAPFRTVSWRLKRVFDLALASVGLVVLAPVLALSAAAVWAEVGRPVLFRQQRVGLDGRPFTVLKLCTLKPASQSESEHRWSVSADQHIGPVGRVLRKTSLDELPQLWNVIRGDMSLVGPRPERPYFVHEFTNRFPRYMARHRVPAGLTGSAQVHGLRGDTSIADRARFDNYYIENWSLWEDCKIVLWTVGQVVRAAGR